MDIAELYNTIQPYFSAFLTGFFTALAPIIAAIGIIVDNKQAKRRDYENQKNQRKLDILETLYETLNEITRIGIKYEVGLSSLQKNMIDELMKYGTSNYMYEFKETYIDNVQRIIDVEMYKQEIRRALDLDISFKGLLQCTKDDFFKIENEIFVLDYSTRIAIVEYSKNRDLDVSRNVLIHQLSAHRDGEHITEVPDISDLVYEISDAEKMLLKEMLYGIVDKYNSCRNRKKISDEVELIENKIGEYYSRILK